MSLVVLRVKRRLEEESLPELRVAYKKKRVETEPFLVDASNGCSETVFSLAGSVVSGSSQPLRDQIKSVLPPERISGPASVSTVVVANLVPRRGDDGNDCYLFSKNEVTMTPIEQEAAVNCGSLPGFSEDIFMNGRMHNEDHCAPFEEHQDAPILCNDQLLLRVRNLLRKLPIGDDEKMDNSELNYAYDFYVSKHSENIREPLEDGVDELSESADFLGEMISINDRNLLLFDIENDDSECDFSGSDESNRTIDYPDEESIEGEDSSSCFSDYN
ncbi:unnamed protein product [Soboliphyme baturini]|uniref:Iwr1 domain-containing protein n=1 Tax=Soboliphyme baturini TaxID=241478 RepID=A0A183ID04_9BILA|nr:unnamed protein product [Soboliphyme baturini]